MGYRLKAGAAAVDITPHLGIKISGYFEERIARDIHDPLFAKALVLNDGDATLAVVVCDLIGVERKYLDEAKRIVYERTGIAPSNILICCTHTHTGPDVDDMGYGELLTRKIADAVQLAVNRLTDAELGVEREDAVLRLLRMYEALASVLKRYGVTAEEVLRRGLELYAAEAERRAFTRS